MTPDIIFLNNKIEYFQNWILNIENITKVINSYFVILNIATWITVAVIMVYIGSRICILGLKNASPGAALLM